MPAGKESRSSSPPVVKKKKMRCLDLFSGIGGFAHGLRHVTHTVAYCDISPDSAAVLRRHPHLPRAPVLPDVTRIDAALLRQLAPDMLCGGFPCQDLSSILKPGTRLGLDGPRSKLFFEIPRIVRESPGCKHVFLENSPSILGPSNAPSTSDREISNAERVIRELQKAGLTHFAHGVFAASEVGALHRRRRWFCVATRAPEELPLMTPSQLRSTIRGHDWGDDSIPRVVPRPEDPRLVKAMVRRCSLLGNSVVPQCVAFAYQTLVTKLRDAPPTRHGLVKDCARVPAHPPGISNSVVVVIPDRTKRGKRITEAAEACRYARPELDVPPIPQDKEFGPLVFRDTRGVERTKPQWQTPRHSPSTWRQGLTMTERSLWNLSNGIYWEVGTRAQCPEYRGVARTNKTSGRGERMSDFCVVNPRFVEHLMGYPRDWTAVPAPGIRDS